MARFDVFRNPDGEGYLINIQAELLDHLDTRVVIPLLPQAVAPLPAKTLNPCFEIIGEAQIMATQFMAAIPSRILRQPVTNLHAQRDEIVAAIDLLMQGF
ncbi:MAG: CcdB family protein [Rhodocyclaceae bacterium]|nr:CcdB family protein [Rhodocyclaceae bacterium]